MHRWAWALAAVVAVGFGRTDANAQGVTTAAVSGRVADDAGAPVQNARVVVTNEGTGLTRTTLTNDQGAYLVPGLPVGGPYRVEAGSLGFATVIRRDITLALGQNMVVNFELRPQALALDAIGVDVSRTQREIINPGRTGAEQLVTQHQIENLPTISRNFTDFLAASPHSGAGAGGTSVGQQNNRFNNIQIDGALAQDLFGLGSTGQPGGQAGARSISIDAVREYQVLTAPYDVRQSGFTGGLINAVTKSGTNEWSGSAFMHYRNQDFQRDSLLVGSQMRGVGEFTNRLFGGTLGGPIIRDRAHFFVAAEWEDDTRPGGTYAIGRDAPTLTGVNPADAERFAQALRDYGVGAGSYGEFTVENPNRNLFGRIDAQLDNNHMVTLRHNYVRATDDIVTNRFGATQYSFESNFYFFESNTNSTVGQLNSSFANGVYNELTVGYTTIRDRRAPVERYPAIIVTVPNAAAATGTRQLVAGAEYFSQGNELDQNSFEITNNTSYTWGAHRLTGGVKAERFGFRNLFWPGMTGEWSFNSIDDFIAGEPNSFRRAVPYREGADPTARFNVTLLGFYGQTEWTARPNVTVTAGLRYDTPIVHDKPENNPAIESSELGRRTDRIPSGNGIISPRLGFNWDVFDDRTTQVRGGAGVFTGRYPFVWLSNMYSNTGLLTVNISCSRANNNLPTFTLDPANPPGACATGGTPAPPRAVINLVDPDFQYPHALRLNAAVDRQLPWGVVGTVEFLHTRSLAQIFLRELNLNLEPVSTTQGGRPVYGTHTPGPLAEGVSANQNLAQPRRIDADAALAVVELTNSDEDRSWSMTLQAQKRYQNGLDLNLSYTHSRAEDVSGLTSSIATSNIGFNPVMGNPNAPSLATSDYETRHKFVFSGTYDIHRYVAASWFYIGHSGDRYSYVYDGDVNADGFEASYASNRYNDLLYVPTDENDITLTDPADWSRINAYIESESCLRENRGSILERNVCAAPWRNRVDTRFTFRVPTRQQQRVELTLDLFNTLNLLNSDWGVQRNRPFPGIELLELRGWDTANNRGIFRPTGRLRLDEDNRADPFNVLDPSSRWQAQVGLRYVF
ncbi:MAG TPA: carboxypeptidase regulatory-like domain-containing protein [Longimicrobiales bacterium]|nr:carboxypeptidase regulatory-like domain-containing protein [Longimicrobiales bacterium]